MIGSSANPGFRDFAVAAEIVDGKQVHERVSFDINPTSRQILENLTDKGYLRKLIHAGGRIHQSGCNGCIGMGQAPASGKISLRTVPRNFPGRSGTREDQVYLCSPETAAASALKGVITDPRTLNMTYPDISEPEVIQVNTDMLIKPASSPENIELEKGPNIKPLPDFEPLKQNYELPVLLKTGDNISTDEILPAGTKVLPFRSNIPEISKFTFSQIEENFYDRAIEHQEKGFIVVGGENYGQGSSREHAAIAPRFLGLKIVIAKNYARIHRQNLINFGILPLVFTSEDDYDKIEQKDILAVENLLDQLSSNKEIEFKNRTKDFDFKVFHSLNERQLKSISNGSLINVIRNKDS
jgi:aconitate hydratase